MEGIEVHPQHHAFLVGEAEFDAIFTRITEHGVTFFADPHQRQPGVITTTTAAAASAGSRPTDTSWR